MPMDRSKFKNIVGGITTPVPPEAPALEPEPPATPPQPERGVEAGEGEGGSNPELAPRGEKPAAAPAKRFAKTGRPKGRTTGKSTREKISQSETMMNG